MDWLSEVLVERSVKTDKFKPSVSSSTAISDRTYQFQTFRDIFVEYIKFETHEDFYLDLFNQLLGAKSIKTEEFKPSVSLSTAICIRIYQ